jgi:hypothetical protein
MSYGKEIERESAYEYGLSIEYGELCKQYEDMGSDNLLDRVIAVGPSINHEKFPAYDIAKQIKEHKWNPTPRQHNALAHSLAHYEVYD